MAVSLNNLANLYCNQGKYAQAETLYQRALAIREKVLGPEHPDTITADLNLALLYRNKGDHSKAASLFKHLIATIENMKVTNPTVLNTLALCHNELSFHTEVPSQNWKEAEDHYKKAVELFSKVPDKIEAANAELNLQTMYHLSRQQVELERVKELTRILEEAGSPKAEKGKRLLKDLL